MRSQAEKERIQIQTAKKMAARFNLTYRSLELTQAKRAAEQRQRDLEAAKQVREAASRYQMTSRALRMAATGASKGKVEILNSAEACGVETMPSALSKKSTPKTVEGEEADDEPGPLPAKLDEDDGSVIHVNDPGYDLMSRITEVTREQDHEEHDAFWLPNLAKAVSSGDDHKIDVAVVRNFLELHDPSRASEAEELLEAHKGREEQLMDALNEQYPPPTQEPTQVEEVDSEVAKPPTSQDQEAQETSSRPKSTRVTGLTLSVRLKEGVSEPTLGASLQRSGDSGYILSAVKPDRTSANFEVNSTSHEALLRERMTAKGVAPEVIDSVIGDTSEML